MPRAKQCPSHHVTLYKPRDFNCYQKSTEFYSLPDYLRCDVPVTQQQKVQDVKSLPYHIPGSFWTFQNLMPKCKKAFLLSQANYKVDLP